MSDLSCTNVKSDLSKNLLITAQIDTDYYNDELNKKIFYYKKYNYFIVEDIGKLILHGRKLK